MKQDATFRERVLNFWEWFPTVADSLAETIQGDDQEKTMMVLGEDFSRDVQERIGGLAWVFGPGKDEGQLSFTLTGEGQTSRQMLSHYWLAQAVEVPGWEFYCSRQPISAEELKDCSIEVAGERVDVNSLMIATEIDEEDNSVNIKAWHEVFENIEDAGRFQILYLLLDEALGEYGTQTKLGSIEFKTDPDAKPLAELPGYLDELWSEKGWDELSPLETYSGYQAEPTEGYARADTIAGYTAVPNIVLNYLNNDGQLEEDPIEGTGAEYVFVRVTRNDEAQDDPLEFRTAIENEISRRLNGGGGYVVGGATGIHNSYIDLVIFDGSRSMAAVREALGILGLDEQYEIMPFAADPNGVSLPGTD